MPLMGNMARMIHVLIEETVHSKLNIYKAENKCKSLSEAVKKLLEEVY